MSEAAKVTITDEDNSFQVTEALLGISGFSGVYLRGPINDPKEVFTTAERFVQVHGGDVLNSDDALLAIRYLERGGKLRVNRVAHYTDITNASTLSAVKATQIVVLQLGTVDKQVFGLVPKYHGANYNKLKFEIKAGSNGLANYFDIDLWIEDEKILTLETFKNLIIPGTPNIDNSNYLSKLVVGSNLVDVVYKDLSTLTGPISPILGIRTFTGGSDGGAITATDYVGSQVTLTGFHAFDNYDDMMQIGVPDKSDDAINVAGAAYASGRQDLEFFAHLDFEATDANIIAARDAVAQDTKYVAFFTGGVTIRDPKTGANRNISELADVMGIAAYVDTKFGPWWSMANFVRGFLPNVIAIPNNFGSKGNYARLNALANRQINTTVSSGGRIYLSGNFSGQKTESKASFLNIVRLLIYLKKTLGPTLSKYLEEPADLVTFKAIFAEVETFFEELKNSKRALYAYKWDGDQDVDNIANVRVNTLADLDAGRYKIKLYLEPIAGLGEIALAISLNRTGELTFELDENV